MTLKSNLKWVALSKAIQIGLQLISLTVLTRLLDPREYGLMAMATVVTNFTVIMRDLGTAAAIIQRKKLDQTIKSTVFWLNVIMGTSIALIILIASPLIAHLFNETALVPVLLWLALSFPIASLGSAQQALLERESHFRKVASIEICASAIALVVALGMAYRDFGVYSLVGQTLATCSISTFLLWRSAHWRPSLIFAKSQLHQLLGFSGNLTTFNLINYFSRNSDTLIIGYYFTAAVLGAYSLAYRVMLFPLQSLTSVVSRSLYPLMSRKQDDPAQIKAIYLKVLTFIASVTAPMMAGLAVLRDPFVAITFGAQWTLVPPILLWLAPTGFIQSLLSTTGSVFMAHGKTKLLMKLGLLGAILQVGAFAIGSQHNVQVLAMLYLVANILNALPVMYSCMKTLNCTLSDLFICLLAPIICALIMAIGMFLFIHTELLNFNRDVFFFICIGFGCSIYILCYRLFFSRQLRAIFPDKLNKWLLLS